MFVASSTSSGRGFEVGSDCLWIRPASLRCSSWAGSKTVSSRSSVSGIAAEPRREVSSFTESGE